MGVVINEASPFLWKQKLTKCFTTMRHSKRFTWTFITFWIALLLYYNNIFNLLRSPTQSVAPFTKHAKFYNNVTLPLSSDFYLINTPGCSIPNFGLKIKYSDSKNQHITCGTRAVEVKKLENETIVFVIDKNAMKKYNVYDLQVITCCYQFGQRSEDDGKQDQKLKYTSCVNFVNGTTAQLKTEVIVVKCTHKKLKKPLFYTDQYVFVKKNKVETYDTQKKWNVLAFGMDTMSRDRLLKSMPHTAKYLKTNNWIDFKGYTKIALNTFPNLISFLTGKAASTVDKTCSVKKDGSMSDCNHLMLWSIFKNHSYFTAYGEDFLSLPDTFKTRNGFKTPPTDHYMRPFYLTGETVSGNLLCTGKLSSTYHMLNYAEEFATSYQDQGFFGFFWSNSYSHNTANIPTLLDQRLVKFFTRLEELSIFNNTFVIFFSDHGKRFSAERIKSMETYYSERMPMLFMKVPTVFQEKYKDQVHSLRINQNRLTTPYDLHLTLLNILHFNNESSDEVAASEACPKCKSLFKEISEYRTCSDAMVTNKWCTCHDMDKQPNNDFASLQSVYAVMKDIQDRIRIIKTKRCTECIMLEVDTILRSHSYKVNNTTAYVVAFSVKPGNNIYEATVSTDDGKNFKHLGPSSLLVPYNSHAWCALRSSDKNFCVCSKTTGLKCLQSKS